jgi:amino acid permease
METLIHLLKGSLGTGILAMPNAFFKAGLVVGFVGTILIGSLCTYCIHVLVSPQIQVIFSRVSRKLLASIFKNRRDFYTENGVIYSSKTLVQAVLLD